MPMRLNPYLAVLLAATIGGFNAVFIKQLGLPPSQLTFFRLVVPTLFLIIYFRATGVRLFTGPYRVMLVNSALNALRIFLFFVGYLYASVGNAVIMLFTWPIFGALFSILFLKERMDRRTLGLILLAFIGIVLMYLNKPITFGNRDFIGMAAMLSSAAVFALTVVIFKKQLKHYSGFQTIFYQNSVGAVIFTFVLIFTPVFSSTPLPSLGQSGIAVFYAFLVGIIAWSLFFYGLRHLKVSHYSLMAYWEVPAAIIVGITVFSEVLTWNMVAGGAMIIAASLLLRKRRAAPAS